MSVVQHGVERFFHRTQAVFHHLHMFGGQLSQDPRVQQFRGFLNLVEQGAARTLLRRDRVLWRARPGALLLV